MKRLLIACLLLTASCGGPKGYQPIERDKVLFWDRQNTAIGGLLQTIAAEFNEGHPGLPVEIQYVGGYSEINRKVVASIEAEKLPAMAVGYQSMTIDYVQAGAVIPLEPLIEDPEIGLSAEALSDFFPILIESNRFPQFGNHIYSFPFCKSVLMMYFNKRVLAAAGVSEPPATWDAFLDACGRVQAHTGREAWAMDIDASMVDGVIFSMGGRLLEGGKTLFDTPAALRAFSLFETLAKGKLAYQIPAGSYDDQAAFAQDRIAFMFRPSSSRSYVEELMGGDGTAWGMAPIPQHDASQPRTVLYGPNVCLFATTQDQQRTAWEFVRYFTSPEVCTRWAIETGYLPIRKSVSEDPRLREFWGRWEYNRAPFDCLPFAECEPNVAGWQEVRALVENALTAILVGTLTGEEAARDLKKRADAVLDDRTF